MIGLLLCLTMGCLGWHWNAHKIISRMKHSKGNRIMVCIATKRPLPYCLKTKTMGFPLMTCGVASACVASWTHPTHIYQTMSKCPLSSLSVHHCHANREV